MPTRTSQKKSAVSHGFPETTWVKCDLTDDQKDDLKARELDVPELLHGVASVVGEGFKLSISYDERSDCVGCYLTAPKDVSKGGVLCLSARAPDLEKALSVLLYKHFEVLREDWRGAESETAKRDQWG